MAISASPPGRSPERSLRFRALAYQLRQALFCAALILFTVGYVGTTAVSAAEPAYTAIGDQQFYSKGQWIGWNAPWSQYGAAKPLARGTDYQNGTAITTANFPAGSQIKWYWPNRAPTNAGVWAYDALSNGSYDGGTPQIAVAPRQVKAITKLSVTASYAWAVQAGDFNLLTELFLYAGPSSLSAKKAEVGFFAHAAPATIAYVASGRQLGIFTDASKRAWQVAVQPGPAGPYFMFLPVDRANVTTGTEDFAGALAFLRAKGEIGGEEWVTGVATGAEPTAGSGVLFVNALSVDGL